MREYVITGVLALLCLLAVIPGIIVSGRLSREEERREGEHHDGD